MSKLAPAESAGQAAAVRSTRVFVPAYLMLTGVLFGPMFFRAFGISSIPVSLEPLVSSVVLVLLVVGAVGWLAYLTRIGQYRPGRGLCFEVLPALVEGIYLSTDVSPVRASSQASASGPLGVLVADAAECAASLNDRGLSSVAEALGAALREAEALASAISVYERLAGGERVAVARVALGRFEDRVHQLRRALRDGSAMDEEPWMSGMTNDLGGLRAAGDDLRTRPSAVRSSEQVVAC